ncbi:MAG: BON domain-containing protein [Sphaerobacter sp.]|nr:BON domain-containing protein [Sphaerobacter sp.]
MTTRSDAQLQAQLQRLISEAGLTIDVSVHDGVAQLVGRVTSQELRQAALDLATMVDGIRAVDDQIEFEVISPDSYFEPPDQDEPFGYADEWALRDDMPDSEPDFTGDVGANASDFQEAVEEAEPYFPPTDPVVRPSRGDEALTVIGGFQDTSMDEVASEEHEELGDEENERAGDTGRDDEDIRDDVLRELREDALTADLTLDVSVINGVVFLKGVVPSIEDGDNAADVASRVPGVREVRDMTEIGL